MVFEHSAPVNRTAGQHGAFGCHSTTASRTLLCAGGLLADADGNAEILRKMDAGELPRPDLPAGIELYGSCTDMATANGVDPALHSHIDPGKQHSLDHLARHRSPSRPRTARPADGLGGGGRLCCRTARRVLPPAVSSHAAGDPG
ncbi:DUF6283 family protein [Streptomyces sp. NPDC090493]|uniref:DUF6283 family protein n=1 Tax=Streptomyces sp. NPDC090493 TaxID=3365964 RepID=UPI0037F88271